MTAGNAIWGRFFGLAAGVLLLAEGYVLWRPQVMGALPTPDLGPFTPYRLMIAGLSAAVGAAVALSSLQHQAARRRRSAAPAPGWINVPHDPPPSAEAPAQAPEVAAPVHTEAEPAPEEPAPAAVVPALDPALQAEPPPAAAPAVFEELDPFPAQPQEVAALEPELPPAPVATLIAEPLFAPPPPEPPPAPALEPAWDRTRFLELTDEGHQLRGAGRLEDALDPYGEALSLARRHATVIDDPAARRDLATALTNVGDIHDQEGRLEAAIALHEESLGLRRAAAAEAPEDPAAQRRLSTGLGRLADARDARGHRSRARDLYRERLPLAERLAAAAPTDPALAEELATTRERLDELDRALAL